MDDHATVRAWVDDFGARVAAVDFAGARPLFDPGVVGFGTAAEVASGLDELEARQWRSVWPYIDGFRFSTDDLVAYVSDDRCQAVAAVGWSSTGLAGDGTRFPRPGRATLVLRRAGLDQPWLGVHTHFSLTPA